MKRKQKLKLRWRFEYRILVSKRICFEETLSTVFSTFDWDQLAKIRQDHWKNTQLAKVPS